MVPKATLVKDRIRETESRIQNPGDSVSVSSVAEVKVRNQFSMAVGTARFQGERQIAHGMRTARIINPDHDGKGYRS